QKLLLRHYPIMSVERVAYSPQPVLSISNTSAANQQARVKTTSDGVVLIRVASAVTTYNKLTWAGNATVTALQTAINALGNGWTATVPSSYANYPTFDIIANQGAMNAKDAPAELRIHISELAAFQVEAAKGWLIKGTCGEDEWFGGLSHWRIIYTAGF